MVGAAVAIVRGVMPRVSCRQGRAARCMPARTACGHSSSYRAETLR
jgi:hypothetical protein